MIARFSTCVSVALLLACAPTPPAQQTSIKYEVDPFAYTGDDWKRDLLSGRAGYSEIKPGQGLRFVLGAYRHETRSGEGRLVYRVRAYGGDEEDLEVYCAVEFDVESTISDGIVSPEECVDASGVNVDRKVYPSRAQIKRVQRLSDKDSVAYSLVLAYDYSIFTGPREILLIHRIGDA